MSIVIRLQNLPLNAKSADIRNFFGGLRIPSGGVHILGGDNGDAFIAFNSDEDARVAMRKDGGKIKDSRVKLFLSSRMEMQYEVEKLTKSTFKDSSQMMQGPEKAEMDYALAERKYEGNRGRESRWDPNGGRLRDRSRSPRRRSRSRKSPSPDSQSYFRERPVSPDYPFSAHDKNSSRMEADLNSSSSWRNSNLKDSSKFGMSTSELQAELERRITEVLEQNPILMSGGNMEYNERPPDMNASYGNMNAPYGNISAPYGNMNASYGNMMVPPVPQVPYFQNIPSTMPQNNMMYPPPMPPVFNAQQPFYQGGLPAPPPVPNAAPVMYGQNEMGQSKMVNAFYATISGLDPFWDHKEVQMLLKGMFIPQSNIRWELDNVGRKTGTAFIKLLNKDSFENLIKQATLMFNNRRLTVSECPSFLVAQYFNENDRPVDYGGTRKEFCYFLKGLHFQCSYEDIMNFFSGIEVSETIILYGKESKATGIGYVSFTNQRDYDAAFALNGRTMPNTNRFIEMKPCSERDLVKAKTNHPSAQTFTSYSKLLAEMNVSPTRRPLCAIITGLSHITTMNKLTSLFSETGFKADAVHITLNRKVCDGRAFIEFSNFRDFDLALQLHNKTFLDNKICVKQILYDEMKKILDLQKAKHFFDFPTSAVPEFMNATEKVPYLWEPPDAVDEHQKILSNTWPISQNNFPPKENILPVSQNFPPSENVWSSNQSLSLPQEKEFPIEKQFPLFPNNNARPNFQMKMNHKSPKQRFPKQRERFLSEIPLGTKKALNFPKQDLPGKNNATKTPPQQGYSKNIKKTFDPPKPNSQKGGVTKPPPQLQGILKNAKKVVDSPKPDLQKSGVTKPSPQQGNLKNANKSLPPKENIRDLIKFNVNKPLAVNTKKNETFEQAEAAEKKMKLSKLSPEKETTPKPAPKEQPNKKGDPGPKEQPNKKGDPGPKEQPNKKGDPGPKEQPNKKGDPGPKVQPNKKADPVAKELPNKKVDTKKVTPDAKDVKTPAEKKDLDKKNFKAKPNFANKRFERAEKFRKKPFEEPRSPPRFLSPPRHMPCTVQFTMVHPIVGTLDFMEFLRGFAYDPGSITRRYTDNGEPTGDVRVTFINQKEAELAIRNLNGVYLMDMRIGMFIP